MELMKFIQIQFWNVLCASISVVFTLYIIRKYPSPYTELTRELKEKINDPVFMASFREEMRIKQEKENQSLNQKF
jgi:hypothetical protein